MAQAVVHRGRNSRSGPEVITGVRSPATSVARMGMATTDGREPQPIGGAHSNPADINTRHLEPPTPADERTLWRFRSMSQRYMVLIGALPDTHDTKGYLVRGAVNHAKFRDGYFETDSREVAEIMYRNPNCRIGGSYWDADLEDHLAASAQYDNFKSVLRANPELARRFVKDIQANDFDDILDMAATEEMAGDADKAFSAVEKTPGGQPEPEPEEEVEE